VKLYEDRNTDKCGVVYERLRTRLPAASSHCRNNSRPGKLPIPACISASCLTYCMLMVYGQGIEQNCLRIQQWHISSNSLLFIRKYLERAMSSSDHAHPLTESSMTIQSDSEQYSGNDDISPSPPSSSSSPVILYTPPTIWGILRGAAINLLLPFVNGLMLGFGELFAHEAAFRLGWGGTKVCQLCTWQACYLIAIYGPSGAMLAAWDCYRGCHGLVLH
jgi:hypothetical protein